jgi:homoserine dehydrogenase
MISTYIRELIALQQRYKTPLLYEASCCASIPIIRSLEDYYSGPWLESLEGIVNGSTNYILSNIFRDGTSYTESLLEAQSLGYAESNPILDTGGFDARSKLSIMIAHAFGVIPGEKDIACIGIHDLHEDTISYARRTGHRIKLIARTWKSEDRISAVVAPHLVRTGHQLFDVCGVFNGVAARSRLSNTQFYHGEGAGSQPTANAVLSDVHAIQNGYRYRYEKLSGPSGVRLDNQIPVKVSLILGKNHVSDEIPVLIDSKQETEHGILIEGRVSLNEIELLHALYPGRVLIQSS